MVFSSSIFIFYFLPIVLAGYYLVRDKYKNYFLLFASLFFYFWGEEKNVLIIILSILINYISGLLVSYFNEKSYKRIMLILAVVLNIGLLFYYKYTNFFINSINNLINTDIFVKQIALPIGISFFTFQGLAYVIDLYWGNVEVQKNPMKIALYICLFPQLIAGPIVRYKDVAAQIDKREESVDKFATGIFRFVVGLAKKIILSNGVGIIVDEIFNVPYNEHAVLTAWLGILCYTLQIYFDFSGYSDMAIGLGKMFGFDFLENFDLPYVSTSITEFWRRWHISLSSFFKDYVYIPLGGSRQGNVYWHIFIVFALTGLWHGAAWNFVVWGLWHGFFRIVEKLWSKHPVNFIIPKIFKYIVTMLIVMIGWVMFRSDTLGYAIGFVGRMFGLNAPAQVYYQTGYYVDLYRIFIIVLSIASSLGIFRILNERLMKNNHYIVMRNCVTIMLMFVCIMYVMNATYNPFIYFRF